MVDIKQASLAPRYLTLDEQVRLTTDLLDYVEHGPLAKVSYLRYGPLAATVPALFNSLICWYAGFRSFGLVRYGRGRTWTLITAIGCSSSAYAYYEMWAYNKLVEPFRPESPLYYGSYFAINHQGPYLFTTMAGTFVTFFYAEKNGAITIPQQKFFYRIPLSTIMEFCKRIKPYRKVFLASWAITTASTFVLGVMSYRQSCQILRERFNRQTLGQVEDQDLS